MNYSGMATAFLAVAPNAKAQVVYVDLDPDIVLSDAGYNVDFDADGQVDLTIQHSSFIIGSYASTTDSQLVRVSVPPGNAVLGSIYPSLLASGDSIAPGNPNFQIDGLATVVRAMNANNFSWFGETGFLGCRFMGGDGLDHYGWVQLNVTSLASAIVMAYGYEATAGQGVAAGASGSVGVADQGALAPWGVVSNPVHERAVIQLPIATDERMALSLLGPTGKVLFTEVLHGQDMYELPMANYAPGDYFLLVEQGKRRGIRKVVKE
ncbi:MAG: hypothetical protein KBH07_04735 [Flavobacteriales bacterium]|nr:hypothetical protein [Flavobacteriales bacterium]